MRKKTIVIVDDHKLIRQMWTQIFANHLSVEIAGESGILDEAIEMIEKKRPDIVLLDINLALKSGFDAVPLIRKLSPGTKIIALSMHNQPSYAKKMLQLGAKGYITKNSAYEEILQAIDVVMNGGVYICKEIKDILSDHVLNIQPIGPCLQDLSLREMEIIKLLKEGLASKEISLRLNIVTRTVEVHRHNILKKLKLKNTASLVNFINHTDLTFN